MAADVSSAAFLFWGMLYLARKVARFTLETLNFPLLLFLEEFVMDYKIKHVNNPLAALPNWISVAAEKRR